MNSSPELDEEGFPERLGKHGHFVHINEGGGLSMGSAGLYTDVPVYDYPDQTFFIELLATGRAHIGTQWAHHFLTCKEGFEYLIGEIREQ